MQQIAEKDVTEKLTQFKDVANIAEKLNSESYATAFNDELKAEAMKILDSGVTIDLDDFIQDQQNRIKGYAKNIAQAENVIVKDPVQEAKNDFSQFRQSISKDVEINEKMSRSEAYAQAVKSFVSEENQQGFFNTIKETVKSLTDDERKNYLDQFDQQHGKQFKAFTIDPIARQDFEQYHATKHEPSLNAYIAFEILSKMEKDDYAKSIKELFKETAENRGMPVEQYTQNQLNVLNSTVNNLSDEQKAEFTQKFNEKYPDGFKTTAEQEVEALEAIKAQVEAIEKETNQRQKEFNDQLTDYLKTEQGNENARIKQTQYLQEMINKEPQNFERLSDNFFTQNDLKAHLPNEAILKLQSSKLLTDDNKAIPEHARKLTNSLKQKVISSTSVLAKTAKQGDEAIISKEQLKFYHATQFKKEYVQAEKKLQMKRQNDKKIKVDNVKMSY